GSKGSKGSNLFRELVEHALRFSRLPVERERAVRFAACEVEFASFDMSLGEHGMGLGGFAAPDRNMEGVDRVTHSPAAEIDSRHQQMGVCLIGREKQRAPDVVERVTIELLLIQPPRPVEIKARQLL